MEAEAVAVLTRFFGAESLMTTRTVSHSRRSGKARRSTALLCGKTAVCYSRVACLQSACRSVSPTTAWRRSSRSSPSPARPGRVEPAFELGLSPGLVSADGHMNFWERGLLKTVTSGELLATIVAPERGQAGVTVDGQSIEPPPSAVASLRLGSGVEQDATGAVRATRAGVVLYAANESLDVVSSHVH